MLHNTKYHRWGPEFSSRSIHVWFRVGRNGVWVGFSRGFYRFPLPQITFHNFSTLTSFISLHFISSGLMMVRQAWSASIPSIHRLSMKGPHRITSLDPTLCWTRVEDFKKYQLWILTRRLWDRSSNVSLCSSCSAARRSWGGVVGSGGACHSRNAQTQRFNLDSCLDLRTFLFELSTNFWCTGMIVL